MTVRPLSRRLGPLVVREIVHALERLRRAEGLTVVLVEQNVKAAYLGKGYEVAE